MDYIISNEDLKASEMLVNKEAERSVLGTFLTEPETQQALDTMPVSLFTGIEKTIIQAFKNAHKKIENITLVELMEEVKKLNSNINVSTLSNLTDYASRKYEQNKHIKILGELQTKRYIYEQLKNATETILNGSDIDSIIFTLINEFNNLKSNTDTQIEDINLLIQKSIDMIENKKSQIKFGYSLLDNNIGGIKEGDYTIIGAKSGVGKTTLALNIVLNVLKQNKKVLIISREMTSVDVLNRLITMISSIPSIKFMNKNFNENDWKMYIKASEKLAAFNNDLIIDNVSSRISQIEKMIRKYKPDLVVIDYLQLLQSEEKQKNENAEQRISNISRSIRDITLKYNCHVIALVQLNNSYKGIPHGENVIRQSAVVYQDATAVIYLHNPIESEELKYTYQNVGGIDDKSIENIIRTNKENKSVNKYTLKLDKNRNGATGVEPITFLKKEFKMYDNEMLKKC